MGLKLTAKYSYYEYEFYERIWHDENKSQTHDIRISNWIKAYGSVQSNTIHQYSNGWIRQMDWIWMDAHSKHFSYSSMNILTQYHVLFPNYYCTKKTPTNIPLKFSNSAIIPTYIDTSYMHDVNIFRKINLMSCMWLMLPPHLSEI